jgi:hypothetical protein
LGARDRFELLDLLYRHGDLALKGCFFLLTDALLAIHSRPQRTRLAQKDIQPREQAVPSHHFLDRVGKMTAHAAHFSPFWLLMHRVVEDQETCHHGLLGTPDSLGLEGFEARMLFLDQPFQSLTKA